MKAATSRSAFRRRNSRQEISVTYQAAADRYDTAPYRRCGRSGLDLPPVSLGLWQNFGGVDAFETGRALLRRAFDRGVTHFDLANNYGPPPGSAESGFGKVMALDLLPYRDELIISTKAGYEMGPGPYGNWGSRKYLVSSLDASLRRMGLDYVDIFYHHRMDPRTPLEETMGALDAAVRAGKALYAGVSNYDSEHTAEATRILHALGTPCLIHQPRYSMLDRTVEQDLLNTLAGHGIGCAVFSPLAQGLLTSKYLEDVPHDARMARGGSLKPERLTPGLRASLRKLAAIAARRGQSLAQMALTWVLRDERITTAVIGARTVAQLDELLDVRSAEVLNDAELGEIDKVLAS
jgi:L-glyceraldehyde 3-phosphate reductase